MEILISYTLILLIVLDPIGLALLLPTLLKNVPEKNRSRVILREMLFALLALLLFFFIGESIISWLQIDRATLGISGSLVLFLIALGMVFPMISMVTAATRPGRHEDAPLEPFIVPIAIPMYAGPSGLSIVMIHGAKFTTHPEQTYLFLVALVLAWLVSVILLFCSQKILRLLGARGGLALERLVGILLILISVQMFVDSVISGMGEFEARVESARQEILSRERQNDSSELSQGKTDSRIPAGHPIFTGAKN
ncbi:MAG: hypothetical protein K6B46_03570 [Opitutales bacterium]|nr:hypothetical protein [Opitutales bacterium]